MDLNGLPREEAPPPHVEARIIDELVRRGIIHPRRRSRFAWLAYAAAAVALFFAGYAVHALQAKPPEFTHVLLLEGGDGVDRVDEYRQWARDLRAQGVHIDGTKLKEGGTVRGFFTIAAANRAEAERIAKTCPHARYGGRIEIREIEKT
jgi:hypothetical protein